MKPTEWLLIGGDGHGKKFWIKGGTSVKLASGIPHQYKEQLYEGQSYFLEGRLYRIGTHCPTEEQLAQIPRLIEEMQLSPLPETNLVATSGTPKC